MFNRLKQTLLITLLCLSGTPGWSISFQEYMDIFDYPKIKDAITATEYSELNKIVITGTDISYPDSILKLYIIASEVTDAGEVEKYMGMFKKLKEGADEKIRALKLDDYNRAEFLLHYLHDTLFKEIQTGELSSYNIGIRDTLDSGKFNCYKSALIYNGFLEFYGYKSEYVLVPNHIYSTIYVDGRAIDVETTNRFGFDPGDRGLPHYTKKFHRKDIQLIKLQYYGKSGLDNFSVMTHVYVNRSHIYSKQISYIGLDMEKNLGRAAALSVIGDYLNWKRDRMITDNVLSKIFLITQAALLEKPESLDFERNRYLKIINHPLFAALSGDHLHNLEVSITRAIKEIRESRAVKVTTGDHRGMLGIFMDEMVMTGKYTGINSRVRYAQWNNSIVAYGRYLDKNFRLDDLPVIREYSRLIMELLSPDLLKENNFVEKYLTMYKNYIASAVYNLGVAPVNRREHERADRIYSEGIKFLREELHLNDEPYMQKIVEIYEYNKKFLK